MTMETAKEHSTDEIDLMVDLMREAESLITRVYFLSDGKAHIHPIMDEVQKNMSAVENIILESIEYLKRVKQV